MRARSVTTACLRGGPAVLAVNDQQVAAQAAQRRARACRVRLVRPARVHAHLQAAAGAALQPGRRVGVVEGKS